MKFFKSMRWISACMLALHLLGCATPYREPKLDPPDATFEGLQQLVAQEPSGALDLFIVHGMCHHDDAWAKEWLNLIAQALGGMRPANPS